MLPDPQYSPFSWPFYYGFAQPLHDTHAGGGRYDTRQRTPLLGNGGAVIPKQSDWVYFTSSNTKSYGILADGSLWGWGEGPLGDGTVDDQPVPVRIGTWQWKAVETSSSCTLAIRDDNTLWAWGSNQNGHLGQASYWDDREFAPRLKLSAPISHVVYNDDLEPFTVSPADITGDPYVELEKSESQDGGSGAVFLLEYEWSAVRNAEVFPDGMPGWHDDDGSPIISQVFRAAEDEPNPEDTPATATTIFEYRVKAVSFPNGSVVADDVVVLFDDGPTTAVVQKSGSEWLVVSQGLYNSRPLFRTVGLASHQPVVLFERRAKGCRITEGGSYRKHDLKAVISGTTSESEFTVEKPLPSVQFRLLSCDIDPESRGSGYTSKESKRLAVYVVVPNKYEHITNRLRAGEAVLPPSAVSSCTPAKYENTYYYGGKIPAGDFFEVSNVPFDDLEFEVTYTDGSKFTPSVTVTPQHPGNAVNDIPLRGYFHYQVSIDQDVFDPRGEAPYMADATGKYAGPLPLALAFTDRIAVPYVSSSSSSSPGPELTALYKHHGGSGLVVNATYDEPQSDGAITLNLSLLHAGSGYTVEPELTLTSKKLSPVQVTGSGWTSLAVTDYHVVAVKGGEAYEVGGVVGGGYDGGSGGHYSADFSESYSRPYVESPMSLRWRGPTKMSTRPFDGRAFDVALSYVSGAPQRRGPVVVVGQYGTPDYWDSNEIELWLQQYDISFGQLGYYYSPLQWVIWPWPPWAFPPGSKQWFDPQADRFRGVTDGWSYPVLLPYGRPGIVIADQDADVRRYRNYDFTSQQMSNVTKVFSDRDMIYAVADGGLWKLDRPIIGPGDHRCILSTSEYEAMAVKVKAAVVDFERTVNWDLVSDPYTAVLTYFEQNPSLPVECQEVECQHSKLQYSSYSDEKNSITWQEGESIIPVPVTRWQVVITNPGSGYEDKPVTVRISGGRIFEAHSPAINPRDSLGPHIESSSTQEAVTEAVRFEYSPQLYSGGSNWSEYADAGPEPGRDAPDERRVDIPRHFSFIPRRCNDIRNVQTYQAQSAMVAESITFAIHNSAVPESITFQEKFGSEHLDIGAVAETFGTGGLLRLATQVSLPILSIYQLSTFFVEGNIPNVEIISEHGSGATAELMPVLQPASLPYCITQAWSKLGSTKTVQEASASHVTSDGQLYMTRHLLAPLPQRYQRDGSWKLSAGFGISGGKAYLLRNGDDQEYLLPFSGDGYRKFLPEDVGNIEAIITNPGKKLTMLPRITVQQPPGVAVVDPMLDGRLVGIGVTYGGQWFTSPPDVTVTPIDGQGSGAAATAVISGPVGIVTVTSGGSGYTVPPRVVFSGPGLQATGTAITDGNGHVTSVVISGGGTYRQKPSVSFVPEKIVGQISVGNGGEYYGAPDVLVFGGSGSGAKANCLIDGAVYEIELLSGGSGCFTPPTVVFRSSSHGSTATATATVNEEGVVTGITITSGGSMYQTPPEISFIYHDPKAGGVAAVAKIKGPVSVVNVLDAGRGYDVPPQVRFAGYGMGAAATAVIASPGGGAAAEATLNGSVLFCKITAKGSGYQFSPRVTVTATDGNNYKLKLAVDEDREPTEAELAVIMPTFDSRIIGPVSSVQIINGGSSYKYDGPLDLIPSIGRSIENDPFEPHTWIDDDQFLGSASFSGQAMAPRGPVEIVSGDTEIKSGYRSGWHFSASGGVVNGVDTKGAFAGTYPALTPTEPYYYQKPVIRFVNSMQMNVATVTLAKLTAASVRKGIEAIKAVPGTGFHGLLQGRGVEFADAKLKSIKDFWSEREFTTRSGVKFKLSDLAFQEPPTFRIVDATGSGHTVNCSLDGEWKIDGMTIDGSASSPYSGAAVLKMTAAKLYVGSQSATASRTGSNGLALVSYSGDTLYIDPQVVISGSGVGASATAMLEPGKIPRKLRAIVVTARGYGYVDDPIVDVYDAADFMKSEFAAAINDALAADKTIVEYDFMYPEHVPQLSRSFSYRYYNPPLRDNPVPYMGASFFRDLHTPESFEFTEEEANKSDPQLKDKKLSVVDYYTECECIDDVVWVWSDKAFTGSYQNVPTVTVQGCSEADPVIATRPADWESSFSACRLSPRPAGYPGVASQVTVRRGRLIRNLSQQEQDTPR